MISKWGTRSKVALLLGAMCFVAVVVVENNNEQWRYEVVPAGELPAAQPAAEARQPHVVMIRQAPPPLVVRRSCYQRECKKDSGGMMSCSTSRRSCPERKAVPSDIAHLIVVDSKEEAEPWSAAIPENTIETPKEAVPPPAMKTAEKAAEKKPDKAEKAAEKKEIHASKAALDTQKVKVQKYIKAANSAAIKAKQAIMKYEKDAQKLEVEEEKTESPQEKMEKLKAAIKERFGNKVSDADIKKILQYFHHLQGEARSVMQPGANSPGANSHSQCVMKTCMQDACQLVSCPAGMMGGGGAGLAHVLGGILGGGGGAASPPDGNSAAEMRNEFGPGIKRAEKENASKKEDNTTKKHDVKKPQAKDAEN